MWECGVKNSLCLPHARGGVSLMHGVGYEPLQSSPRTWGCFLTMQRNRAFVSVFPTHVGVFPAKAKCCSVRCSLPHARGGVSRWRAAGEKVDTSSPRTWGCFSRPDLFGLVSKVFPTHVGVFLKVSAKRSGSMRLPHARGGVSGCVIRQHELDLSSPRTWGCF